MYFPHCGNSIARVVRKVRPSPDPSVVCCTPYNICTGNIVQRPSLAFTRYCYYQYCIVYSIQTEGREGSRILANGRAIVLHQGGQCRWAGGIKGWWILARQPRSKRISCKGQEREDASRPYVLKRYSRIPGMQPQEYESRIPPGEPCI